MKFNALSQLGVVVREVGQREYEGKPARVLVASRVYDAGVEEVWDALTRAERIPRWLMPISGDLRLGGRYQLEGNAGGTILACEPRKRLRVTWELHGMVSWVEVKLEAADGHRTRLELEHIAHVPDALWAQFGPGAVGIGWDLTLLGLARHLATRSADRNEALAWSATEEARAFMRGSGEGWRDASISAGTDAAAAQAAAAAVFAMYGG